MTDTTPKPATRRTPAKRPPKSKVRMEYLTLDLPEGTPLEIPYPADGTQPPEVQVLSVDRIEGSGHGIFDNRWHVVVVWR